MAVKDFVVDNDIDILAMTETWLRPGTNDSVEIGTLCPTGYRVILNLNLNFELYFYLDTVNLSDKIIILLQSIITVTIYFNLY